MATTRRKKATKVVEEVSAEKQHAANQPEQPQEQPSPPVHPKDAFEQELSALLSRYDPFVGTLFMVKMLGVHRDEMIIAIAEGMARQAIDQAVHIAMTKTGRFRRQASPRNKATKKRKKR